MRHIDIEDKSPEEDWLNRADALTKKLLSLKTAKARKKLIEANQSLWRELEPWLHELSHDKCWYSEAKDCASYWHVDHFRPKNEVKDLDGNFYEGYYWLAFRWQNYRLAGSALNVPKSSLFPVRKGTTWAATPDDDIADESPYLLDPISPSDPKLLSFDESGRAIASDPENEWNRQRANVTIKIINLNYKRLKRARQRYWEKCNKKINRALNLMLDSQKRRSKHNDIIIREIILQLQEMVACDSQFSAVATTCVLSQGVQWLTKQVIGN
jgi:uncharacterized protein (TIGR02646 family)